ncbi:MAG: hypothetical protein J6S48_02965 [Bacteroidales bacterium]|nr:hypothetical protein [Bacteroidales bacterium]
MRVKCMFVMLLLLCIAAGGCRHKEASQLTEDVNYDYPITIIQDTLAVDVLEQTTLYPLTEEFVESFLEKANTYAGHPVTAATDLPTEWGVRCVERLPEGRELWLLQSQTKEWMYLAVTSGYGTQRILDVLPVALEITNQNDDLLETEKWITHRQPDGAFLTFKEYEWTRSLSNATKQDFIANPEKFHRTLSFTDRIVINESGRFEYTEIIDSVPEHSAVVFFYNSLEKPEMWDEYIPRLQAFCEENNIYFEEVYNNYDRVEIRTYLMEPVLTVDINPYVRDLSAGMVMLKKGESPKSVNFGGFEYMQMEIKRYFKVARDTEAAL